MTCSELSKLTTFESNVISIAFVKVQAHATAQAGELLWFALIRFGVVYCCENM